jgi:hypothetical protein
MFLRWEARFFEDADVIDSFSLPEIFAAVTKNPFSY